MKNIFSYEECLECGWKSSSHQGKHFPSVSIGCLFIIFLLFTAPFWSSLIKLIHLVYLVIGLLAFIALIFLIHAFFPNKNHHPKIACPKCGSDKVRHVHGLWE